MKNWSDISKTNLITLRARMQESVRAHPVLKDRYAEKLVAKLELNEKISKVPHSLSNHIALRGRKYDQITQEFLHKYPDGLVVSMGAGLDTRFWRTGISQWNYLEIDLPEIALVKRSLFNDQIKYSLWGISLLDFSWIKKLKERQTSKILFLCEGVLMYLPPERVKELIQKIAENFTNSQIVAEVVHERFTRGWGKKIVESKMRRLLGTQAGSSYLFGVSSSEEFCNISPQVKLASEWCYLDEEDVSPRFLGLFKNWKLFRNSQWTIILDIK